MSGLERLKMAEEAGPMEVLVIPHPEHCCTCPIESICEGLEVEKPEGCPLRKAIGIIEPNGHVVYFWEEKNEQGNCD